MNDETDKLAIIDDNTAQGGAEKSCEAQSEESSNSSKDDPRYEAVVEALKQVEDPELFLDIWFLGLIYNIRFDEARADIEMTFTTPLCPAGPSLVSQVKEKVGEVEGVDSVEVEVVFSPAWTPSEDVQAMLGMI